MKLFTATINSVTQKANVFIKARKKLLTITKELVCKIMNFITAIKSYRLLWPVL